MAGQGNPSGGARPAPARTNGVDALDRNIIRLLQRNGRLSNTEIARTLKVTETTVRKRMAHLLERNLMNVVAVPTPEAVGMNLSALIGISVNLTALSAAAEALRRCREVRYVGVAAGRFDIIIEAFFTDQEHLLRFVTEDIGPLDGVTNIETSVILKVVKFSYEWEVV